MNTEQHPLAESIDKLGKALVDTLHPLGVGFVLIAHLPHEGDTPCAVSCVGNMAPDETQDLLAEVAGRMTGEVIRVSKGH